MMRRWMLLLVTFWLAGCGVLTPQAPTTVLVTVSAQPPSSVPPSTAPPPTPTASATPAARNVLLLGSGLAKFRFGATRSAVEPELIQRLGRPEKVVESTGCEFAPRWTRVLIWKGLSVQFEGTTAARTANPKMSNWDLDLSKGIPARVFLGHGLTFRATFAQVAAKYPAASLTEQLGWHIMATPVGVTYWGDNTVQPKAVNGGGLPFCD